MMFARSIGDTNPIYYDQAYADKEDTGFGSFGKEIGGWKGNQRFWKEAEKDENDSAYLHQIPTF